MISVLKGKAILCSLMEVWEDYTQVIKVLDILFCIL